jgi:hypothetical protein
MGQSASGNALEVLLHGADGESMILVVIGTLGAVVSGWLIGKQLKVWK